MPNMQIKVSIRLLLLFVLRIVLFEAFDQSSWVVMSHEGGLGYYVNYLYNTGIQK